MFFRPILYSSVHSSVRSPVQMSERIHGKKNNENIKTNWKDKKSRKKSKLKNKLLNLRISLSAAALPVFRDSMEWYLYSPPEPGRVVSVDANDDCVLLPEYNGNQLAVTLCNIM